MAIVEKEMVTVAGWSVAAIVKQVAKWQANPQDVALEVTTIGHGVPVPMLVWFEIVEGEEA